MAAAVLLIAACYAIDEPENGVESISTLIPPYPAVVFGDQSRDTLGSVAPFRVIAFDQNGDTVHGVEATFVPLQRGLTFDAQGIATGDSVVQGGVEVVGTVFGLQTLPVRIPVTVMPVRARKEGEDTIKFVGPVNATDTANAENRRELRLILSGDAPVGGVPADTFTVGFIVDFRIVEAPDATQGNASAVLTNGSQITGRDTTDQSGIASRTIQLRPIYFGDSDVLNGVRPDTVIVEATVRYPGVPAAASPVRFIVPVVCKNPRPGC
ncbi:MAG TPA: hypothetical protein VFZ21_06830 [Gemmatimonadaceae bacterium]|nr:hypothetical protein [Gemmatimonadaceae bacterium]